MERVGFLCVLLCGIMHTTSGEILPVSWKEGNVATLYCGKLTEGKVTWSRDVSGEKVDILTTHNGEMTKHIADPDRRYSSGANLVLSIFRVRQSDAGRYYCNGTTVELTVRSGTGPVSVTTEKPSGPKVPDSHNMWIVVVAITAGSCLVALVSVGLLWRYFSRKKAENEIEHLYAKVQKVKK